MTPPPRIAPGTRSDVGLLNATIARVLGRVSGTNDPNLFLTLGRHRRLFRGWLRFAGRLMPGGRLPRRETEMVILRVAHRRGCTYELEHHRRLGRRAGLSNLEIESLGDVDAPTWRSWTERESAQLRSVDELLELRTIDDTTWELLRRHLDEREAIELVMLTAHYDMLAATIGTLRIESDVPRRG